MASSLAASAIPALVMARGHRIDNLAEVPLVVDNKVIDNVDKSSKAVALLKTLNAYDDVMKAKDSVNIRAGKGKARNRRYVSRRGPLVIYSQENTPMVKAFRNVAGVDLCNVSRLNVLQLAPGGHLGRFVIWTRMHSRDLTLSTEPTHRFHKPRRITDSQGPSCPIPISIALLTPRKSNP